MSGDKLAEALNANFAAKMAGIDETGSVPPKAGLTALQEAEFPAIEAEAKGQQFDI